LPNILSPQTVWKIAALGFGLIVGVAIIFIMQFINYSLYPIPDSVQLDQAASYSEFINEHPVFLAGSLLANAAGCFTGGAIAIMVRSDVTIFETTLIGLVLMILGIINTIMAPHPAWYLIISILIYIPSCWLGAYFIKQTINKNPEML
jgi:CDP-diglyceride synthetase